MEAAGGGGGSWYVAKEEIERRSPSRRDGVEAAKEAELRATYCSFIRDVGIRLQLPQVTIATAIVLCHRFYLRQSHAKNEWQTVATVCIFLASKIEDTPCQLQRVVIVAYETMYRKDCDAAKRIYQKEILEKQKELILVGETLLLSTIRFDFNIQHPYEPLKLALKNLGMSQKEVKQVAVNLINDTLRTTLVVQFKPHYIAAGALFLSAKFNDVKLPSEKGKVWWHEFEVAPDRLEAVIHQMTELYMKRNPCSMDTVIKPIPGPIPTEKQQTIKTSDPSRRSLSNRFDRESSVSCRPTACLARNEAIKPTPAPVLMEKRQVNTLDPSWRRLHNNFDRAASRCMPVDNSASHHSSVCSARNGAIKPIPAPISMENQRIVNTSDPLRRRLHNNFDREASRCMPVDSSASRHLTVCSARNETIKPIPSPIPMENQQIVNTLDPSRQRLRNNFDREASRYMPVDSSASRHFNVCSARNEAIKPIPAPIPMKKHQIINTSDLSRRILSNKFDREVSRCMPVDSASHYTMCSARNEVNQSLQTHVDRSLNCVAREGRLQVDRSLNCVAREGRLEKHREGRLVKQSSRAALEADHVYHVYGRPQDINVATIRTYIRRKRTNQEVGDHPAPSNKSDKDAWIRKQHGSVIVVDTKLSSFKKQKL